MKSNRYQIKRQNTSTEISHEEIKTKANQTTVKPLAKYEHAHSQSINIIQESAETEQKSILVKANGETTMKVPENASLQQSVRDFYLFLLQKCSKKFASCSTNSSSSQHFVPVKNSHVSPLSLFFYSKTLSVLPPKISPTSVIETLPSLFTPLASMGSSTTFMANHLLRYQECFPYIIISLYHLVLRYQECLDIRKVEIL